MVRQSWCKKHTPHTYKDYQKEQREQEKQTKKRKKKKDKEMKRTLKRLVRETKHPRNRSVQERVKSAVKEAIVVGASSSPNGIDNPTIVDDDNNDGALEGGT